MFREHLVQTVSSDVHLVQTEQNATSNRQSVTVNRDGQVRCAVSHVLRGLMELDATVSVPAKMVEHVTMYRDSAHVLPESTGITARMDALLDFLERLVRSAVLSCAPAVTAIAFSATVNVFPGSSDPPATNSARRIPGDPTASGSVSVQKITQLVVKPLLANVFVSLATEASTAEKHVRPVDLDSPVIRVATVPRETLVIPYLVLVLPIVQMVGREITVISCVLVDSLARTVLKSANVDRMNAMLKVEFVCVLLERWGPTVIKNV